MRKLLSVPPGAYFPIAAIWCPRLGTMSSRSKPRGCVQPQNLVGQSCQGKASNSVKYRKGLFHDAEVLSFDGVGARIAGGLCSRSVKRWACAEGSKAVRGRSASDIKDTCPWWTYVWDHFRGVRLELRLPTEHARSSMVTSRRSNVWALERSPTACVHPSDNRWQRTLHP